MAARVSARWLSPPTVDGPGGRRPWARKHVETIRQAYARAPFLARYLPALEALLQRRWERLVDLDVAAAAQMAEWLGLERRVERSSTLGIEGERSDRLFAMCRHFGAATYLSGDAARAYLDLDLFARHGITVEWQDYQHPVYSQQHGGFVSHLSALDLLLNHGDDAALIAFGGLR